MSYKAELIENNIDLQDLVEKAKILPIAINLNAVQNPADINQVQEGFEFIDNIGELRIGTLPVVEQATPSITVDENGLITATSVQENGKVTGGIKSATEQLLVKEAEVVTPDTTEKIVVASNTYVTGDVKVEGCADLKAENIAVGVTIFGVTGSLPAIISSTTDVGEGTTSSYPDGTLYVVYREV